MGSQLDLDALLAGTPSNVCKTKVSLQSALSKRLPARAHNAAHTRAQVAHTAIYVSCCSHAACCLSALSLRCVLRAGGLHARPSLPQRRDVRRAAQGGHVGGAFQLLARHARVPPGAARARARRRHGGLHVLEAPPAAPAPQACAHTRPWLQETLENLRKAMVKTRIMCAILLDTKVWLGHASPACYQSHRPRQHPATGLTLPLVQQLGRCTRAAYASLSKHQGVTRCRDTECYICIRCGKHPRTT